MSRKLAARRVTPAMEAGFPVMLGLWRKVRYAHLSQAHLKESVSLLNYLPSGKEMVNIGPKGKGADNLTVANPS